MENGPKSYIIAILRLDLNRVIKFESSIIRKLFYICVALHVNVHNFNAKNCRNKQLERLSLPQLEVKHALKMVQSLFAYFL